MRPCEWINDLASFQVLRMTRSQASQVHVVVTFDTKPNREVNKQENDCIAGSI